MASRLAVTLYTWKKNGKIAINGTTFTTKKAINQASILWD
jgi:hypothetical protein